MDQIMEWLKHGVSLGGLSAPAWTFIAIVGGVLVEYLLGRFAPTRCASLIALIATGLRLLLTKVIPIGLIPVVGPMIVHALESIAGVDLDGDGNVGAATARTLAIARKVESVEGLPPGTVTKDPPGGAAAVLLIGLAMMSISCGHIGPVIDAIEDCTDPLVCDLGDQIKPTVLAVLECSGLSVEALPPCVLAGLGSLAATIGKDGPAAVDCIIERILAERAVLPGATGPDAIVHRRAAAYLGARKARGVKLKVAAP